VGGPWKRGKKKILFAKEDGYTFRRTPSYGEKDKKKEGLKGPPSKGEPKNRRRSSHEKKKRRFPS